MKRSVKLMALVIFLSLMLAGVVLAVGKSTVSTPTTAGPTPAVQGKCCIAGKYEGFYKDTPSKT